MINEMDLGTPFVLELREKKRNECEGKFERIILEAVDEIFCSLGQSCKEAIYFQLETAFELKRGEIPLRMEDFASAIERIFGVGARFIELRIIEALHERIPNFVYFPKLKDVVFTEYVASLNRFFMVTNCESH